MMKLTPHDRLIILPNVDQELDAEFTVNEIKNAVFHKKNINKASGPDEICAEILKSSFDYIYPFLLN